jgi:hypothetical protein
MKYLEVCGDDDDDDDDDDTRFWLQSKTINDVCWENIVCGNNTH